MFSGAFAASTESVTVVGGGVVVVVVVVVVVGVVDVEVGISIDSVLEE
jgi:hypothetical protein